MDNFNKKEGVMVTNKNGGVQDLIIKDLVIDGGLDQSERNWNGQGK